METPKKVYKESPRDTEPQQSIPCMPEEKGTQTENLSNREDVRRYKELTTEWEDGGKNYREIQNGGGWGKSREFLWQIKTDSRQLCDKTHGQEDSCDY